MGKKEKKPRTIDLIKKERQVTAEVKEDLKKFNRIKRSIRQALEEGPMTIPQISEKLGIDPAETTYYVMSLRKYGFLMATDPDDMDEYFYYQRNK